MRPVDRLLTRQQELDAEVDEDQHLDVDDERDESVHPAPVHGALLSLLPACLGFSILRRFLSLRHFWTDAKVMRVLIRKGEK